MPSDDRWLQGYALTSELEHVGIRYATEVYDGRDRLICECERPEDAALIVRLRAVLVELVTLHDARPADYAERKVLAWQAARTVIDETSSSSR